MQLIMIDIPDPVYLVLANRQPPRGEDVHLPTSEAARVSLDVSHNLETPSHISPGVKNGRHPLWVSNIKRIPMDAEG